jgi:cytochrome c-type biogenesis protein CcmF
MNIVVGRTGLLIALVAAALGVVFLAYGSQKGKNGLVHQGRTFLLVSAGGLILAVGAMERAFLTHDFSLSYVAGNNSRETPLLFTITGLWSGLQGSMLLWSLILGLYIGAMVVITRKYASSRTTSLALVIAGVVAVFFLALLVGPANPFTQSAHVPLDGLGPNPLLQEYPLVAVHPPMLYLGFVGMTVPFAFYAASLITGEDETFWLRRTRNWTLVAWVALTIGITLGAWWSYQTLGWGGFWAWDPVENAAFLPWLCATAFLHSSIAQQRRFSLRVWNFSLVASAFALTILGTYFTRSGVLESVHAFSASNLGTDLITFFGVIVVFAVGLVLYRAERLRSQRRQDVALSKEGALIVNNVLFAGFAFVILLGTSFPLLVRAMSGATVTVGTPYFNSFAIPIGLMLLFFMAIAPLVPWRKISLGELGEAIFVPAVGAVAVLVVSTALGETRLYVLATFMLATFAGLSAIKKIARTLLRRNGRPLVERIFARENGGMVVHLGIVIIAFAMVSTTAFGHQGQLRLAPGQTKNFYGESITYLGVQNVVTPSKSSFEANILIDSTGPYHPAISQYGTYTETVGMPAVNVALTHDTYLTINSTPNLKLKNPPITLGIIIQPLISWLWIGALIVALGALLAGFGFGARTRPSRGTGSPSERRGSLDDRATELDQSRNHVDVAVGARQ